MGMTGSSLNLERSNKRDDANDSEDFFFENKPKTIFKWQKNSLHAIHTQTKNISAPANLVI